jgi:hypothetical protein
MEAVTMRNELKAMREDPKGRVGVPLLMWVCGVPLGLVLVVWFFFFRG